jgi:hypothetical protein
VPRRVLFVIRGKLGDSLVLYAAVRRYVEQFPGDRVVLAIRRDYARLLRDEPGFTLLPFGSRLEMIVRLAWLRAFSAPFDVLAVLWGFGPAIRIAARLVAARRRIYLNGRFADLYPEWPDLPDQITLVDPAMEVIRCFEPRLTRPEALLVPSLAAARFSGAPPCAIGVVPIADELRRNLEPSTLDLLVGEARRRHPGRPLRVFVNPVNRGAGAIVAHRLPAGAELRRFSDLRDVVREFGELEAWYGTDTGLYHLAVAMGIPATVFFGPTQPWKIVMPRQPEARWVRLAVLGQDHCEEKACTRPLCLEQAVASYCGGAARTALESTPRTCPLRAHPAQALTAITVHERTDRQAR